MNLSVASLLILVALPAAALQVPLADVVPAGSSAEELEAWIRANYDRHDLDGVEIPIVTTTVPPGTQSILATLDHRTGALTISPLPAAPDGEGGDHAGCVTTDAVEYANDPVGLEGGCERQFLDRGIETTYLVCEATVCLVDGFSLIFGQFGFFVLACGGPDVRVYAHATGEDTHVSCAPIRQFGLPADRWNLYDSVIIADGGTAIGLHDRTD